MDSVKYSLRGAIFQITLRLVNLSENRCQHCTQGISLKMLLYHPFYKNKGNFSVCQHLRTMKMENAVFNKPIETIVIKFHRKEKPGCFVADQAIGGKIDVSVHF